MLRIFSFLIILFSPLSIYPQELNSKVLINTEKLQSSESLIFEEMQNSIEQFLNNKIWTEDKFESEERINCNFIINILNEPSSNLYEATVQIVSSRPIFNLSFVEIIKTHLSGY